MKTMCNACGEEESFYHHCKRAAGKYGYWEHCCDAPLCTCSKTNGYRWRDINEKQDKLPETIDSFLKEIGIEPFGTFKPVVYYDEQMDSLIYINKDCSYTSHQVNKMMDYLLDPYEEKLVGWRIHGFIYYFGEDKMKAIKPLIVAFLTPEIAEKLLINFEEIYNEKKDYLDEEN